MVDPQLLVHNISTPVSDISLSVVIPAYNEEANIREAVGMARRDLSGVVRDYEIIIINDGSSDGTSAVLEEIVGQNANIKMVIHAENRGKGAALVSGFNRAKKEWVLIMDADLQIPMAELAAFLPFTNEYEVIVGYRSGRRDSIARLVLSKIFSLIVVITLGVRLNDINCPFKLMKSSVIKSLDLNSRGFFIDTELIRAVQEHGIRIRELAVSCKPRQYGRSTVRFRHVVETVRELIRIVRFRRLKAESGG